MKLLLALVLLDFQEYNLKYNDVSLTFYGERRKIMYLKKLIVKWWYGLKITSYKLFGKTYKSKICGHLTKLVTEVQVFGEYFLVSCQQDDLDYCPTCVAKMSILCAYCKSPIFIGDPIMLCIPKYKYFEVPAHAVVCQKNPLQVVRCLKPQCVGILVDRMGFWVIPGKIQRVLHIPEIIGDIDKAIISD